MIELKAQLDKMTVFQLQELSKAVTTRLGAFGVPPATASTAHRSDFCRGDVVEFYSKRAHKSVKAVVDRVNEKTVSCQEVVAPFLKWRVSPGLLTKATCPSAPIASVPDTVFAEPSTASHIPSGASTGIW